MNIHKMKHRMFFYENILLNIEQILCKYDSKDKRYLIFENNRLKDQCKNGVKLLGKLKISIEENDEEIQNYFEKIKLGILDLFIILRLNNFGALKLKIESIEKINTLFKD